MCIRDRNQVVPKTVVKSKVDPANKKRAAEVSFANEKQSKNHVQTASSRGESLPKKEDVKRLSTSRKVEFERAEIVKPAPPQPQPIAGPVIKNTFYSELEKQLLEIKLDMDKRKTSFYERSNFMKQNNLEENLPIEDLGSGRKLANAAKTRCINIKLERCRTEAEDDECMKVGQAFYTKKSSNPVNMMLDYRKLHNNFTSSKNYPGKKC
eukprot:TRINITY_DN6966_c0_g1_i2.p1 TRINITY_DN6966_c0_g1~~TRINITY_DN6966_c0_g1_i2.p1  ORF type:complete len:209 (+),score=38.57 TRINITY_DN6966_c0_g1_i2:62-688(+)